ncbi:MULTISPECIES: cytochrome c family protein [Asticcacaulis]|uniref:c-type cytochrome n=1 Tax=Asticcacaulis TaxID=76890 RepID=UPI001FD94BE9|nr:MULTISPECIES: c-type cytochrome [Asticcacaulis]MBP2161054.1 cytochrome c [Asticcacaulis solisilvae]MDR6802099.1 cytochrome c [Asticcacaulis sp. BE141]
MTTMTRILLAAAATATLTLAQPALADPAGDAVAGKKAYAACGVCHAVVANKNGVGPSLFGIVGKTAGSAPGFKYSDAMKAAGKWTPEKLDAFLADPKKTVPGNKMPFAGMKDPKRRADVVAYIQTLK